MAAFISVGSMYTCTNETQGKHIVFAFHKLIQKHFHGFKGTGSVVVGYVDMNGGSEKSFLCPEEAEGNEFGKK